MQSSMMAYYHTLDILVAFLVPYFSDGATCLGTTYYRDCSEAGHSSICKGVGGCSWVGDGLWGYCEGTVSPCEAYRHDVRGCKKQLGCKYHWDQPNPEEDNSIDAILPLGAACLGTTYYRDCSEAGHSSICKGVGGCSWGGDWLWGYCRGTITPCEAYSNDARGCNNQLGCKYYLDQPNPEEDNFIDAILPLGADLECVANGFYVGHDMFPIVCTKCRDSTDGYVCYEEVTMNPVSTSCFLEIDGVSCQSCQMCGTGSHIAAFSCANIIDFGCIGQDCNGVCV